MTEFWMDTNNDGYTESLWIDNDGDGVIDLSYADVDADGRWDQMGFDSGTDGIADSYRYDVNEDGYWEGLAFDPEQNGVTTLQVDLNGDGYAEAAVIDTNMDGVAEQVSADFNSDGVFESNYGFDGNGNIYSLDPTGTTMSTGTGGNSILSLVATGDPQLIALAEHLNTSQQIMANTILDVPFRVEYY